MILKAVVCILGTGMTERFDLTAPDLVANLFTDGTLANA